MYRTGQTSAIAIIQLIERSVAEWAAPVFESAKLSSAPSAIVHAGLFWRRGMAD